MKRIRTSIALGLLLLLQLFSVSAFAAGKKSAAPTLKNAKIRFTEEEIVYTGEQIEPEFTVTLSGETLTEGVDYTAEFSKNTDAGQASVRIQGIGAYSGSARRSFTIAKAENECEISDIILPSSPEAQEAELDVSLEVEAKLSYSSNRDSVKVNRQGIVKIAKGFAGIAEITVTAPGSKNYKRVNRKAYVFCYDTPEITETFCRSSRNVRLTFTASKNCTGYEIRFEPEDMGQEISERFEKPKNTKAVVPLPPGASGYLYIRSLYEKKNASFSSPWSDAVRMEVPEEILLFGSDYQSREDEISWQVASDLFGRLSREDCEPDRIVICGDYTNAGADYTGETDKDIANLKEDLAIFFDDTRPDREEIFIQGNHDRDKGQFAANGPHESEHSIVYVMNTETANPWQQGVVGEPAREILMASTQKLCSYLAGRVTAGEHRPILIATHVPLHFSQWTETSGDNLYSGILFDVLNEFGDALDIVYLFGHSHGGHGDSSIGGSRICRVPGETILIPDPAPGEVTTTRYRKETLRFVYMNAGYIGYCAKVNGERGSSVGILTLYQDRMELSRSPLKGKADVSAAGERTYEGFPEDYLSVQRETAYLLRKRGYVQSD